jgi:C4-dicarboxylate transporter DctM subunit
VPKLPRATLIEVRDATLHALPAFVMPFIIVGGIVSGAFTPTEAGAAAVAYGLLFGLVTRRHTGGSLYRNFAAATQTMAAALIALGGAALFAIVLARAGVADVVIRTLLDISQDKQIILLIVIGFLLILGMFLESVPALILTVPVLQPISLKLGYDPVHFGIIVLMTLVVGAVTPPVGIIAMVAAKIGGVSYSSTFSSLFPYVMLWVVVIVFVAFVPATATWLPNLLLK